MGDSGAGGLDASRLPGAVADGIQTALKQSFTDGVNAAFRIAALVGVGAVLVSLLMAGRRKPALAVERGTGTAVHELMTAEDDIAVGQ
jgi:hypothetical protein